MTALCTIRASDYVALCKFASTEETRPYLRGVCVERQNDQVWLVATDGHCLGAIRALDGEAQLSEAPVIVSSDKALLRLAKSKSAVRNTGRWISQYVDRVEVFDAFDLAADSGRLPVATLPIKPVDGSFPDWRKVMPRDPVGLTMKGHGDRQEIVRFNPAFFARFQFERDDLLTIEPHGGSAAIVLNKDSRFFGLLMPGRGVNDAHDILSAVNMIVTGEPLERPTESVAA